MSNQTFKPIGDQTEVLRAVAAGRTAPPDSRPGAVDAPENFPVYVGLRRVTKRVWMRLLELGDLAAVGSGNARVLEITDSGRGRLGTETTKIRNPTLGPQIVDWQERNLVHGKGDLEGKPYRPADWMKAATYRIYEHDPVTYRRFVERVVIGIGKGNAKTEWAASIGIAELAGPVVATANGGALRESPNIPIGAASREQANLCFGTASVMIEKGPLAPFFDVLQYEIKMKGRPGRMYRIAAEAGTQDGTLPTCFVADEVHEWVGAKRRVHTVVTNSLTKRESGLEVNISTAGDPEVSDLLMEMYEYGKRVRAGDVYDPSFLFMWFEPSDPQVKLDDPEALRVALREANPSPWIDPERLARRWEVVGIRESVLRRYHLNQWVTSGESFIGSVAWNALAHPRKVKKHTKIIVGFDGSYNGDSTALIGCTYGKKKPHLFEIKVWEKDPSVKDWRVPRNEVDTEVEETFRRYDVVELVCDPARWSLYIDAWTLRYGDDRVVEYPNVVERMMPATAKFHDGAIDGLFTHDGSSMLTRHVANAVTKVHPRGYVIRKDHPDRKIDAAVAGLMAYDRATVEREVDEGVRTELW